MRSRLALLVAIVLGAVGVAANATASAASTHVASAASAKSPVKLMALGAINAPGFSLPSIPVGAQVAINQINKAGGLNGHPIKLITCNDENNPNTATACAREAITDKVAAVVGGLSIFDLKIIPYLKQAGIPWIGPATPDDYTSKNLFLLGDEGLPANVAIGEAAAKQGCKKVAIVLSAEAVPSDGTEMGIGAKSAGAQIVASTQAPATSPDWDSIVAADRSAGAQCIAADTGPSETAGFLAAVNAGAKLKVVLLGGGLPDALVAQLGSSINGVMAISGYLPSTSPGPAKLRAEAHALAPSVTFDGFTEHGYASVEVVAQAVKLAGLKTITASTLTKALPDVSDYNTGLGPIVDLAAKPPVAAFPRLFNPYYYIAVAKNGKMYLKSPKSFNVTSGLKLLAASGQA